MQARRGFFKTLGVSFLWLYSQSSKAEALQKASFLTESANPETVDIDRNLLHLVRDDSAWPQNELGYFSSFYQKVFHLKSVDPQAGRAFFSVNDGQEFDPNGSSILEFQLISGPDRIDFKSLDQKTQFFWKPQYGFYALDPQMQGRVVELCQPLGKGFQLSNNEVTVSMDSQSEFYAHWTRSVFWEQGIQKSPLKGFEGFAEESLQLDSSLKRDQMVAKGLNLFFQEIPMGLVGLKTLAKVSPKNAVRAMDALIPRVFGWMIGPTENIETGKILLTNCPYRARLGTQACESTCGHAIGKYFSQEVGLPMRFDPSVDNYTKCHILVGKDQCS